MENKLEAEVLRIRETLGDHIKYMNSLVDPIYDRKIWTRNMAADALTAANVANTSASMMLVEVEKLQKKQEIKEDPRLAESVHWVLIMLGRSFGASGTLIELADQDPKTPQDLERGIGWSLFPSEPGIRFFRRYFGAGHDYSAWSTLRTAWSLLFFMFREMPVKKIQLGAVKTKAYYDDDRLRHQIMDEVHAIVETENVIVDLYDDNGNLLDSWGPSEVRVAKSHATKDWGNKPQAPGTVTQLTRALTKKEQERAYAIYLSSPENYPNAIDSIRALGIPGLVVEGVGAKSVPLKHTIETYITKDKYFVSKGKRISRKLDKEEIRLVKDIMRNRSESTIEEIAGYLNLDVVKLPEEYDYDKIEHAFQAQGLKARSATPNISSNDRQVYNILLKWRRRA
jgi:hypothetical protein